MMGGWEGEREKRGGNHRPKPKVCFFFSSFSSTAGFIDGFFQPQNVPHRVVSFLPSFFSMFLKGCRPKNDKWVTRFDGK